MKSTNYLTGDHSNGTSTYLDNGATSFPKPDCVIEAMTNYMIYNGTSSSRGAYRRAIESDQIVYEARKNIGKLFNFKKPSSVIFTSNITEAINLAASGILKENDHVITSSIEHNAVWRCLKTLERDRHIKITNIKTDENGFTFPLEVEKSIEENTKLIIFNHASNVIGTIQPIREIGKIARKHKIPFMVDTAQTAGMIPIDMEKDCIDILAFTGHKSMLGPMGTGGLVINWEGDIAPLKAGGTGGDSAYEYQPDYLPNKYEAGTMNVPGIAGLGASVKYILEIGIQNIYEKEKELLRYTLSKMETVVGIIIYGCRNPEHITGVISFNIMGMRPEEVAVSLDQKYNIMIRAGLHCSPLVHRMLGTIKQGTARIGIGYYTTKEDIDHFIEAISNIAKERKCI